MRILYIAFSSVVFYEKIIAFSKNINNMYERKPVESSTKLKYVAFTVFLRRVYNKYAKQRNNSHGRTGSGSVSPV